MTVGTASDRPFIIRKMVGSDIEQVRALASNVWGDQLFRDTGIEVEYPSRDRKVYRAYLVEEPNGNFVAEVDGSIIGAAYSHTWGSVGWVGPLEIDPVWQGKGVGSAIMAEASRYLDRMGCSTQGVETMGENDRNTGFYSSLGYSLHSPTFVFEKVLDGISKVERMPEVLSTGALTEVSKSILSLTDMIFPGMDMLKEFRMACDGGLGKVLVVRDELDSSKVLGASIVHDRTVEGMASHLLRALIVDPGYERRAEIFSVLLSGSENVAKGMGAKNIFFTSAVTSRSISMLADMGYRAISNNVRMLRTGNYQENGELQLISWAG